MAKVTTLGGMLRHFRRLRGFNIRTMANMIGRDKGLLSKYENDKIGVTLDTIDAIADAAKLPRERAVLMCLRKRYPLFAERRSAVGKAYRALLLAIDEEYQRRTPAESPK